jgi:cell division protein FtsB
VLLAVAALLLTLFVYAGLQSLSQRSRLSEQHRVLGTEVATLTTQLAELQGLRDYISSEEYIEAVARTRFGLVRPGETAVIVDAPAAPRSPRAPGERWWEALFER